MSHSYPPKWERVSSARDVYLAVNKALPPLAEGVTLTATWIGGFQWEICFCNPVRPWRERCVTGNFRAADMNEAEFQEAIREFAAALEPHARERGMFAETVNDAGAGDRCSCGDSDCRGDLPVAGQPSLGDVMAAIADLRARLQ